MKSILLLFGFIVILSSFDVFIPKKEKNKKKTIDTLNKIMVDLKQLKGDINANNK